MSKISRNVGVGNRHALALAREASPLCIGESKTLATELLAENLVLFFEVFNHGTLLSL